MNFDIDVAIVVGFLVLTLVVGLGHGQKVKNIKDYALGGRNFSTEMLIATIVATWASGSMFFTTLSKTYSGGIEYLISLGGFIASFFILAFVFIPRMQEFLGKISIAEAIGDLYGKNARVITALAGTIGSSGKIAVQFSVFGNLIAYFLNISSATAIIVTGILVTVYSAFGGIRSVTFTDLLQFITFGFVIPLIGILVWNQTNDSNFIWSEVFQSPKFNVVEVLSFENKNLFSMLALFLYFAIPSMKPYWFQRVSMGSDIKQVKKAFIISGCIFFFIILSMAWIPFLIFHVNPDLDKSQLLGFIVDTYTYPGLKGLVIIAVTAMAMSTADSNINASSVLFSNDLCKPLNIGKGHELLLSKLFAIFLGLFSIGLAFIAKDLLSIILLSSSFYMPIVTPVLILTILGFRSSSISILIGMFAGFITTIIWISFKIKVTGGLPVVGLLINMLFLISSHYIFKQPGGWKSTKVEGPSKSKLKKTYFLDVVKFLKKYCPKEKLAYTGFGIYCIIYTITTIYSSKLSDVNNDSKMMVMVIYQIMMITGIAMASYPIWPLSIKEKTKQNIIHIWWYLSLFYMLSLFSSFFVMLSDFSRLQFILFTINTVLLVVLSNWRIAIPMLVVGFYFGIAMYKKYSMLDSLEFSIGSSHFIFVYILVLLGTITVLFLKPKQEQQEATEAKVDTLETEVTHLETEITDLSEKVVHYSERVEDQSKEIERLGSTAQRILNNVNHELRLPVGNVMNFAEMLNDGLGKFNEEQLKTLSDEVYKNSNRLSSMILNMLDLATLEAGKIELQKKIVNFSELVHDRVQSCRKIYLQDKKIDIEMQLEENILINIDPNYIRQTVDNLVINAINFSQGGIIKISVLRRKDMVEFVISDQGVGIPQSEIYDIFTPFKMGSNTESKAEGRGVGLALCKAAIEAHGGMMSAKSIGGKGAQFRFVLKL